MYWTEGGRQSPGNEVSVYWRSDSLIGEGENSAIKFGSGSVKLYLRKNGLNTFDATVVNTFSKRKVFASQRKVFVQKDSIWLITAGHKFAVKTILQP